MAIEEINAAGGLLGRHLQQFTADIGDTSPDKVKSAYASLADQHNVDVILTPYLFASGPDFDVVSKAQIPYFHHNALSDSVDLVKSNFDKYWMIFEDDPTEHAHGIGFIPILDRIIASGKWKPRNHKIYIVTADNAYSTKIANTMSAAISTKGWNVVALDKVVSPFTEWGPILAKIRQADPDVIFNTDDVVGDVAAFQNQFAQNPTKSLMYQQYAPSVPEYLTLTGAKSTGVIWATVQGLLKDDVANAFSARYQKRWNAAPGGSTAPAIYDSTYIYANAVLQAGGPENRRKVADNIRKMIYRGATGAHSFLPTDNHVPAYPTEQPDPGLGMPHLYYQIRGGKHQAISPAPYIDAEFELPPWF